MRDALGTVGSVLVLGGTSDIGLAIAKALAVARGARRVVLAGRDHEALADGASELGLAGTVAVDVELFDALDTDAHPAFVDRVWDAHGDIDVVVVAFGVLGEQAVDERDPGAALQTVAINYVGAVSVLVAIAQRLVEQGQGRIVVLSSVAGERARKANFVYGSSKAGLDAFAQGLGDRLRGTGVEVLVARPGFVHSRMTAGREPAPFATTPEAVAREVVRGLDRGAHTVYVPPVLRWVMAVLRHLPRPLFRLLPR